MNLEGDSSRSEQIYMLEIFIHQLEISAEKLSETGDDNIVICIKLLDLPPFEISTSKVRIEEDRKRPISEDKENRVFSTRTIDVKSGKTFLIAKTPRSLQTSIRCLLLEFEIFKLDGEDEEKPCALLCKTKVPLPCSFHDQIHSVSYGADGLPMASTIQTKYRLFDKREELSGSISTAVQLMNFGNTCVSEKSMMKKSLVFNNSPSSEEFSYVNVTNDDAKRQVFASDQKEAEDPRSVSGNCMPFARLADKKLAERYTDQQGEGRTPLTWPDSSPRISIDQPGFENLTSAEKLNDSSYRDLVYRSYPDEPTCSCLPRCQSMNPMICQSGCMRSCCMMLRKPAKLLEKTEIEADRSSGGYCPKQAQFGSMRLKNCNDVLRMRGGGEGAGEDLAATLIRHSSRESWTSGTCKFDYKLYPDNLKSYLRLEGGGGEGCVCTADVGTPRPRTEISNSCRPGSRPPEIKMPGCTCTGKEVSLSRRGTPACSKKPCAGVDCLLRAYREAQDFVDSLGKVPGLVGLGLMDPSDSPFFGRVSSYEGPKSPGLDRSINPQCTAPCNPGMMTRTPLGTPFGNSIGFPVASAATVLPGRTGVVREGLPTLPDPSKPGYVLPGKSRARFDRKDDIELTPSVPMQIETGPCGEPTCRSRPVGYGQDLSQDGLLGQRKGLKKDKSTSKGRRRGAGRGGRGFGEGDRFALSKSGRPLGPPPRPWAGGDFSIDFSQYPIKLSKQVLRFVYTVGDYYPGINYGHRDCIDPFLPVPANMGWRWNTSTIPGKLKPRLGWKPGAIPRALYEKMLEAKAAFDLRTSEGVRPTRSTRSTRQGGGGCYFDAMFKSIQHDGDNISRSSKQASAKGQQLTRKDEKRSNKCGSFVGKTGRLGGGGGGEGGGGGGAGAAPVDLSQSSKLEDVVESDSFKLECIDDRLGGGGGESRQPTSKVPRLEGGSSKVKSTSSDSKGKPTSKSKKGSKSGTNIAIKKPETSRKESEQPPTLHIQRKDGTYYVTMYPIRQEPEDETHLPEPIKPLHFKIVKNKDDDSESSSTASDMEIEFSPPAAIQRQRKRPDVVHTCTQVRYQDILEAMGVSREKKKKKKDTFPCR